MARAKLYLICIVGLFIIIYIGVREYNVNSYKNKLYASEQNYKAAMDSLNVVKLKNDALMYEKQSYILSESELEERLDISKHEINELKKELNSSLKYISNISGKVNIDTIVMTDTIRYINDSIQLVDFGYYDKWLSLNGTTNIQNGKTETFIYNIDIPIKIQTGLTSDHNIFVKTDNPYINITDIKGAQLDVVKQPTKVSHSIYIGAGLQYGLLHNNIDIGPQVGYGISISF